MFCTFRPETHFSLSRKSCLNPPANSTRCSSSLWFHRIYGGIDELILGGVDRLQQTLDHIPIDNKILVVLADDLEIGHGNDLLVAVPLGARRVAHPGGRCRTALPYL